MHLTIIVQNSAGSDMLHQTIEVPDDVPYPTPQDDRLTLLGLKTAIDFYFYQERQNFLDKRTATS